MEIRVTYLLNMLIFLLIIGAIGLAIAYVVWSENNLSSGGAYRDWAHSYVVIFQSCALCPPFPKNEGAMLDSVLDLLLK